MHSTCFRILAISGSVRANSSNTTILKAISRMLPESVTCTIFEGITDLPYFNPDMDHEKSPEVVNRFRKTIDLHDALLICTPEYAFGVPGVLKNALDWIVSTGELTNKPTAAISASPLASGGDKALASLVQTLKVMGAMMSEPTMVSVPVVRKKFDEAGTVSDPALSTVFHSLIDELGRLVERYRSMPSI